MKKFNSTLAIAAIAFASVFGFTSCEKDNSAFEKRLEKSREIRTKASNDTTDNKRSAELNRANQISKMGNHEWINKVK